MTKKEFDELMEWSRNELGGIAKKEVYSYQLAIEITKVMQKDVEAFKKLSSKEQEAKFWEYKSEMDALSDEELEARYEKYF